MTNENKGQGDSPTGSGTPDSSHTAAPAAPAPGATAMAAEGVAGAAPSAALPPGEALEVATLKAEVADLKDRLLRAHADMDNIRKRTEREKADAHKYAITKFARDIVTVGDNFQRAIDTVPPGAADQDEALKSFLDGVVMTERELINVLDRNGVKRIDPKGELFNPHHHQAVMEMPNPDVASGTITQVFQPGYMIEDRVLRPAMVVVARGGFKPVKPVETPAQTAAQTASKAANDDAPPGGQPDPDKPV